MYISWCLAILLLTGWSQSEWGFFAHRLINKNAVFSLPPEMVGFYKRHINVITENAVNPDRRRYAVEEEAARHYIDIDHYGDSALFDMPRSWYDAIKIYPEDTLLAYGIVPWHISLMKVRLTNAFKTLDKLKILMTSADLAHYIADANVPLHTTENYNGQLTGQHGIHGFWESRLPELFSEDYDLLIGQAQYLESPQSTAWSAVVAAHNAVDSVLRFESDLTRRVSADKKFSYDERGASFVQVYSEGFSTRYHLKLDGMVERRMKSAIKMVADFWFTCWVDAGQPDLSRLDDDLSSEEVNLITEEKRKWRIIRFNRRPHDH